MSEEERSLHSNTPDDEKHEKSISQWLARPQTMIALSAVVLSVCGLFVATYETQLLRQHQRASVWPHVEVQPSLATDRVRLMVQNTGVGPARIQAATLTINGQQQDGWEDMILYALDEPAAVNAYQSLINGRVLPAGSAQETIFTVGLEDGGAASTLVPVLRNEILEGNLDIELCYCSVYEDCWTTSMQDIVRRSQGVESTPSREVNNCRAIPQSGI